MRKVVVVILLCKFSRNYSVTTQFYEGFFCLKGSSLSQFGVLGLRF